MSPALSMYFGEEMASSQFSQKCKMDCQCLHLCFSGNGAIDGKKLVEILTSRNMEELKLIRQAYRTLYNHDILHLLSSSQRSNKLAMAAYLCMTGPYERDSAILRGTLFSSRVNANTIFEILGTRSSLELRSIKQAYYAQYNSDLEQDVAHKTNGNGREILRAILSSSRNNGGSSDMSMAMCDAKVIYEAMESGKSVDWRTILCLISQRSSEQLMAILNSYKRLYGHEFSKSLKRAKCGDLGKELHAVIKGIQHPEKFFAKQLRRALRNSNAQEALIRTIITRSEIDIKDINHSFSAKTGWSMESLVRSEFGNTDKNNGILAALLTEILKR